MTDNNSCCQRAELSFISEKFSSRNLCKTLPINKVVFSLDSWHGKHGLKKGNIIMHENISLEFIMPLFPCGS
jgi:hypothetical protein